MDIQTLSDELILHGVTEQMQDMYIQCKEERWQVVFRKGETFYPYCELDETDARQLITRFKYLGEMDVGENRKVQLGAITYSLPGGRQQRLRLSGVGDYRMRNSLVVRFLHPFVEAEPRFFIPEQLKVVEEAMKRRGLYLFAGPTGSGKTTLMYQLARQAQGQVITIEDPVEIEEPNFLQLQVNPKIQQTYDVLIQLSLRHRPDVLIIGEIRDQETAQAAIRAALTGVKVFATVHAKGIAGTNARIRELVMTESELGECLEGVIYQRLLPFDKQGVGALLAYRFSGRELPYDDWQENLQNLYQQGGLAREFYEKEI